MEGLFRDANMVENKVWRLRDGIVIDGAKHFGHFQERRIGGVKEIDWADNINRLEVIDQNTEVNRRHCKHKQDASSKKLKRTKCLVMNDYMLARLIKKKRCKPSCSPKRDDGEPYPYKLTPSPPEP